MSACKAYPPNELEGKQFYTQDNGGRPFLVECKGGTVEVKTYRDIPYPNPWWAELVEQSGHDPEVYTESVCTLEHVKKVWVGDDDCKENTYLEPGFCTGSSMLIQHEEPCLFPLGLVGKIESTTGICEDVSMLVASELAMQDRYTYVGDVVYSFRSEPIEAFHSHLGPNDVPYPIALTQHFCLIFAPGFVGEGVVVSRNKFRPTVDWHDATYDYFGHKKDPFYFGWMKRSRVALGCGMWKWRIPDWAQGSPYFTMRDRGLRPWALPLLDHRMVSRGRYS